MSFKELGQAFDLSPEVFGGKSAKLLMLALLDRANERAIAWPSRSDIERRTGLSQSSITRETRKLERNGWLKRKSRFNASTIYRLNFGKLAIESAKIKAAESDDVFGFEPFEEEKALQAIENKGDGHSERGYGHSDHTDGHSDHTDGHAGHLNPYRTLKEPLGAALAFSEYPSEVKEAVRSYFNPVSTLDDLAKIERFVESVGCSSVFALDGLEEQLRFGL